MENQPADVLLRLSMVEKELRGYVVEGAAMAYTLRDSIPGPRRRSLTSEWLDLVPSHVLLAYIGIGFAMARLPRRAWNSVWPDRAVGRFHPRMSWLIVDGLGFDWAYFHPEKWIDHQTRPTGLAWMGDATYFPRAFDQGLGRALWFLYGGSVPDVSRQVGLFDEDRRADLWAGVGLAASMVPVANRNELRQLREAAGPHWPDLALGATFAAVALKAAGHVPADNETAVKTLTGQPLAAAVVLAWSVEPADVPDIPGLPVYEYWRDQIRSELIRKASPTQP